MLGSGILTSTFRRGKVPTNRLEHPKLKLHFWHGDFLGSIWTCDGDLLWTPSKESKIETFQELKIS